MNLNKQTMTQKVQTVRTTTKKYENEYQAQEVQGIKGNVNNGCKQGE